MALADFIVDEPIYWRKTPSSTMQPALSNGKRQLFCSLHPTRVSSLEDEGCKGTELLAQDGMDVGRRE